MVFRSLFRLVVTLPLLAGSVEAQQTKDNLSDYGHGLIIETPGSGALRGIASTPHFRNYLPSEHDLSGLMPMPGRQGKQGSCTAWAVAYAARTYHYARDNGVSARDNRNIASPAALYNAIHDSQRDCGSGSRISDGLNHLRTTGVPSIADFPYDAQQCRRQPLGGVADQSRFRIEGWRLVNTTRLDDVKGQIANGRAVIVSTVPHDSFKSYSGGIYSDERIDERNAHALTVVGYSDRRQAFKVINSWGTKWGEGGFAWIDYPTFKTITRNGFVMDTARSGPVVPPPVTPPQPSPAPIVEPSPRPAPDENVPPHVANLPPAVRDALQTTACSGLTRFDPQLRRATIYAGDDAELSSLKVSVAAALPGYVIETELRKWPQCEALQTFDEPISKSRGLAVRIRDADGEKPQLRNGRPLVLDITMPAFPSYLYLLYFPASGDGVHLMQPQGLIGHQYDAGQRIVLGDGSNGGPRFTIGAPFGAEMIVAVAAASPLFDTTQPPAATEREMLTLYRKAMLYRVPGQPARTVAATALALTTQP